LLGLPRRDWSALHRRALAEAERRDLEQERERLAARKLGTRPTRELAAYAGAFEHDAYGTVRVTLERGVLTWRWNECRGPLEHFHYDTFSLAAEPVGPAQVVFTLDGSGAVARMKVGGNLKVEFRRARR